jgi:hypothetical protein
MAMIDGSCEKLLILTGGDVIHREQGTITNE